MNIRKWIIPAVAGLVLGAAPASAERQQDAGLRKVDCHATFAAFDGADDAEFQPVDSKASRKARPKAKANGSQRGAPLRPCIVLASA